MGPASAMMAVSKAALDRKSSMTKPSIPVGVICSQSGPYQAMGQEILKSALMAIDGRLALQNSEPSFAARYSINSASARYFSLSSLIRRSKWRMRWIERKTSQVPSTTRPRFRSISGASRTSALNPKGQLWRRVSGGCRHLSEPRRLKG